MTIQEAAAQVGDMFARCKFVTVSTVAKELQIAPMTARKWIHRLVELGALVEHSELGIDDSGRLCTFYAKGTLKRCPTCGKLE